MDELTTRDALTMIEAARQMSEEAGVRTSVAVVDGGGNLLAFLRMDRALLVTLVASQTKARTALLFGAETGSLNFDGVPTQSLIGLVGPPVAFVSGGVPIRKSGRLIGAIGIGGGSPEQDHDISTRAVQAGGFYPEQPS